LTGQFLYTSMVTLLYLSDYRGALTPLGIVMAVAVLGAILSARLQSNRLESMDRTLLTRALL
jgi:hypothetical protein